MRPIQIVAGITAASLFAVPLCSAASPAQSAARVHFNSAQVAAARAKALPLIGYPKPGDSVNILVHLPLRNRAEAEKLSAQMATPGSALYHKFLTPALFAARYGPAQSDLQSAAAALRASGFSVSKIDSQFIHASAPAASVERAFGTKLGLVRDGNLTHVDARTPIAMPSALAKLNASVIGLTGLSHMHADGGHGARLNVALRNRNAGRRLRPNAVNGPTGPYFPLELRQAYSEPSYTWAKGTGESIAIVGYSDSSDFDNHAMWCYYGLGPTSDDCPGAGAPYPTVNHYDFLGSIPPNTDFTNDSFVATEAAQMAGGTSPGAIIDQFAADEVSNFGFLDAFGLIVSTLNDEIIVTPYSNCEYDYLSGYYPSYLLYAYYDTFLQGTMQGQTFLFSSGDTSNDACWQYYSDSVGSVSAFAADPDVTGVGGTTLLTTTALGGTDLNTTYVSESSNLASIGAPPGFWGSGGGTSLIFSTPGFQTAIGLPPGGRQVPDIAMHMGAPAVAGFSSDVVAYEGSLTFAYGTAESASEFAGWIANGVTAVNAGAGAIGGFPVGNINNLLYFEQAIGDGAVAFHQIIPSQNLTTTYNPPISGPAGYNEIIGLGTPNMPGVYGLTGLSGYQVSGNSVDPTNP